jgi:hypothetical protein
MGTESSWRNLHGFERQGILGLARKLPSTVFQHFTARRIGPGWMGTTGTITHAHCSREPGRLCRDSPDPACRVTIAITHDGKTTTFKNLFIAEIQVVNKGNRDLDELMLGATLGEGDRCIYVESAVPDRYHKVDQSPRVCPDGPQQEVDFVLRPFNRGDSYSFKFYVVIPEERKEPSEIVLGSASPVRFVEMPTVGEIVARAASEVAFNVGPIKIGLR